MSTYEQLDQWRQDALTDFVDHRIVDHVWVDTHIWYFMHLYAEFSNCEWAFRGFSCREKGGYWLLTTKVTMDGIPYVVFMSSDSPTSCMRKLREALREGTAQFYPDAYA